MESPTETVGKGVELDMETKNNVIPAPSRIMNTKSKGGYRKSRGRGSVTIEAETPEETSRITATSSRGWSLEEEFCVLAEEDTEVIELVGNVPAEQDLNARHSPSFQVNDSRDGQVLVQAPADISQGQVQIPER